MGSGLPFLHLTLPFENACYLRPWLRPPAPFSTLSPVRMPVCGLRQFLRTQRPPLHPDLMPSAALAPHGAALWCGRPVWSMHTGPPHGRAALAWFRR